MQIPDRSIKRLLPIPPGTTWMINRARRRFLLHDPRQQMLVDIPGRKVRLEPVLWILVALKVVVQIMVLGDLVVLVVAGPDDQCRVVTVAAHDLRRLGRDLRQKGWVGRVAGAGEGEIVPHENAELVAGLEERRGFVDAAAPDADYGVE
jgi:hypothetical protein